MYNDQNITSNPLLTMGLVDPDDLILYTEEIVDAIRVMPHFFEYFTVEWVFEQARKKLLQVWVLGGEGTVDLVILTQINVFPAARVFQVIGAAGRKLETHLDRISDVFDKVAEMHDCSRIEVLGRPGWARKLRSFKAEYDYVVLSRAVGAGRRH